MPLVRQSRLCDVGLGSRLATARARPHTPTRILDTSDVVASDPRERRTRIRRARSNRVGPSLHLDASASIALVRAFEASRHAVDMAGARRRERARASPGPHGWRGIVRAGRRRRRESHRPRRAFPDPSTSSTRRPRARLVARGTSENATADDSSAPDRPLLVASPSRTRIPRPRRRRGAIAAAAVSSPASLASWWRREPNRRTSTSRRRRGDETGRRGADGRRRRAALLRERVAELETEKTYMERDIKRLTSSAEEGASSRESAAIARRRRRRRRRRADDDDDDDDAAARSPRRESRSSPQRSKPRRRRRWWVVPRLRRGARGGPGGSCERGARRVRGAAVTSTTPNARRRCGSDAVLAEAEARALPRGWPRAALDAKDAAREARGGGARRRRGAAGCARAEAPSPRSSNGVGGAQATAALERGGGERPEKARRDKAAHFEGKFRVALPERAERRWRDALNTAPKELKRVTEHTQEAAATRRQSQGQGAAFAASARLASQPRRRRRRSRHRREGAKRLAADAEKAFKDRDAALAAADRRRGTR